MCRFVHSCSVGMHVATILSVVQKKLHSNFSPTRVRLTSAQMENKWTKCRPANILLWACRGFISDMDYESRLSADVTHPARKATVSRWLHLNDKPLTQTVWLLRNIALYTVENTMTDKITHLSAVYVLRFLSLDWRTFFTESRRSVENTNLLNWGYTQSATTLVLHKPHKGQFTQLNLCLSILI